MRTVAVSVILCSTVVKTCAITFVVCNLKPTFMSASKNQLLFFNSIFTIRLKKIRSKLIDTFFKQYTWIINY